MKFNRVLLGSAIVMATFGGQEAFAADAAAGPSLSDILTNSGIVANGWISGSYVYGFNHKQDSLAFREFDGNTDSFLLNQAALNISMLPTEGFGGAVTLLAGEDAQIVEGAFRKDGSSDQKFTVNQAYFQYASGPLTVIGGRYNTLAGYEVIADPLNVNLSRSLLFFNEPFVHTGIRAAYKVTDMVTGYLGVNNTATIFGAGDDNNKQKTVELGVSVAPTSAITLALYDYYGVDGSDSDHVKDNYLDFVGSFAVTDQLSLGLNADWGHSKADGLDDGEGDTGPDVKFNFYGVAGYINYKISDLFRVSVRAEATSSNVDNDGVKSDKLNELTGTFGYSPAKNFDVLFEARVDQHKDGVDDDIFVKGHGFDDQQGDVAIKGIYKFGL